MPGISTGKSSKVEGRSSRRYLLYLCDTDLSDDEIKEFRNVLERRHRPVRLIEVSANRKAVIVKTNNKTVSEIRRSSSMVTIQGKSVSAVLTSGAIGKLKSRASGSPTRRLGEVSQR